MDLVLGVSVADGIARLAVVGGAAADGDVIGQLAVQLKAEDQTQRAAEVAKLVFGAHTAQALKGHRTAATGLCWDDAAAATLACALLRRARITTVAVIDNSAAVAGVIGRLARGVELSAAMGDLTDRGGRRSGALVLTRNMASLSLVGAESIDAVATRTVADDAAAVCVELIGELSTDAVDRVYLVGDGAESVANTEAFRLATKLPTAVPNHPEFAVACGAALVAPKSVEAAAPPETETDAGTAVAAMLAAAAKRNPTQPPRSTVKAAPATPALTMKNYATAAGTTPTRYSDVTVKLHRQPPKPKVKPAPPAEPERAPVVVVATVDTPAEADKSPDTATEPQRSRRPRLLVGSAVSALLVAGVAAIAVTAANGVEPAADQRQGDAQVQVPVNPAPAAVDANQVIPAPQLVMPPLPEAVGEPAPEVLPPAPEELMVPGFVDVVPEAPVVEVPAVVEVPGAAPEPVVPAPEAVPAPIEGQVPATMPDTAHVTDGVPPGAPIAEATMPDPSLPAATGPQPLPQAEVVAPPLPGPAVDAATAGTPHGPPVV
ncbi:MAG: hypothetical protein ACSLE6_19340, partial [Mycobacterium sp.]